MSSFPFVSVIIPAKNAESYLQKCIDSVRAGTYPKECYEIIVVDNGSIDQTIKVAEERADRVISAPGVRIGALRNLGAEAARGSVFAFLDSDCLASKKWIESGIASLQKEVCITGATYEIPTPACWIENDWFSQRENGRHEVSSINGGNIFVTKELFIQLNGFDDFLATGEDTEFCERAKKKGKVIADDSISVVHLGNPKTVPQFLRREIWYGLGAFGTFRHTLFDKPLIGTLTFGASLITTICGILGGSPELFFAGVLILGLLLALTIFWRRRFVKSVGHGIRLTVLYCLFYFGRLIGLMYYLVGKDYYHNIKAKR
jgi:glycosyltransferase involved in cell wall biosynthesis